MPLPLIRRARHDVQIAGLQAERDKANTEKRQIGAALSEALRERDAYVARNAELAAQCDDLRTLLDTTYVRTGPRFVRFGLAGKLPARSLPTPPETNA